MGSVGAQKLLARMKALLKRDWSHTQAEQVLLLPQLVGVEDSPIHAWPGLNIMPRSKENSAAERMEARRPMLVPAGSEVRQDDCEAVQLWSVL